MYLSGIKRTKQTPTEQKASEQMPNEQMPTEQMPTIVDAEHGPNIVDPNMDRTKNVDEIADFTGQRGCINPKYR